ncbi:hypothetical protein L208DRAFT_1230720 [Tricholoma matsutake]|nr:hypothetical protein L208DRAFT_1230720 [Tricholoma matsutake 945]
MDISISAPGYIGLCDTEELKDKTTYGLDDLVGENSHFKFKLQKWDGRKSIPIEDHAGWIFCVGIGQPNDNGQPEEQKWSKAMEDVEREMKETREQCSFDSKDLDHCRGPFPALAAGVSFGGGQVIPGNLIHN